MNNTQAKSEQHITLAWVIVIAGVCIQYATATDLLFSKPGLLMGFPIAPLGIFLGFIVSWIGFVLLYHLKLKQ